MFLYEVLPPELCQMIWEILPLRARVTTSKVAYEKHYHALVASIPRLGDYAISLARDSSATYVFKLLFDHKREDWASFGRWKQWTGKYTGTYNDYFAFLRHICRESANHRCLLVLQEGSPDFQRKLNAKTQRRPLHTKNKRQKW